MTDPLLRAGDGDSIVERLDTLLAFDRRAASAYREAAERLGSETLRRSARHFCDDHERHLDELTRLRRAYGGGHPVAAPPAASELDGEPAREIAGLTSDRAILRTLKTLARSGRDSYRGAVKASLPAEVAAVLRRASNDETTHYAWALEMLDDLDSDRSRLRRSVGVALDESGARLGGFVEVVERRSTSAVARVREGVCAELGAHPVRAAIVALGVGMCAATLGRGRVQAS
jgi:rubrerythrin